MAPRTALRTRSSNGACRWPARFGLLSAMCSVVTLRAYLRLRAATEREAFSDALTGLGNRRALGADLDVVVADGRDAQLVLLDLHGFKGYNDTFGHRAGDALLERLGGRLRAAIGVEGAAYRMGGDEFCVLVGPGPGRQAAAAAVAALTEHGDGFAISASHGRVALPGEASDSATALRLADRRMRGDAEQTPAPAGEQATHALLSVLFERHADMGDHCEGVAELAEAVARRLGAADDRAHEVRVGAELHDIGKAAIPDAILSKPGPLNDDEWRFMRRHTLIGERIVASADALAGVAKLVRSSHERWDGDGYPDGLAGEAIPLGARIISVCDAFDAMLADRPYSTPMTVAEALAELRRCAGAHFDPRVVAAFDAVVDERAAHPLAAAPGLASGS